MPGTKYPINREFFPYNTFTPSVSKHFVLLAQKGMNPPGLFSEIQMWKYGSKRFLHSDMEKSVFSL